MKLINRWIACICAVALLICAVPVTVFANEGETNIEVIDTTEQDGSLNIEDLTAADIIGEVDELREADTKHFMMTDGSMIAVSYPVAVHEQVDGEWVDIDNTLRSVTDEEGDSVEQTASQNIRFSFVNGKGNGRLMKVEDTRVNAQVIFELQNAQKKNLIIENAPPAADEVFALQTPVQTGTFKDVLPDIDIEYIVAGNMLKENIIMQSVDAVGDVSFVLRCKNVTASLQEDGSVALSDADNNAVFTIPAPFMYDAAGEYSEAVSVSLTPHSKGYVYTLTPDETWIRSSQRVFPVTIDPTVTSSQKSGSIDSAFVKESQPNFKVGNETFVWVGNNTANNACYGLFKFELPSIKASDYVVATCMNLYSSLASTGIVSADEWRAWSANYLSGSMVLETHAITESWNESNVTWNTCPAYDTSIMEAIPLTSEHAPELSGSTYTPTRTRLNISEIGGAWYNDGLANNGVLLKLNNEGNHAFAAEYFSDLGTWVTGSQIVHPQLYVQYRSKAGLEDAYSYSSASAGTAGDAYVQLSTGNTTFVHDDLGLEGGSMPVSISHVYNVCNSDQTTVCGKGWTLNYAQTLRKVELNNFTYYAYTDADATVHYFDVTQAADEYEDGSGLELKLNADKNKITDKDDNEWHFDANGRLVSLKNGYGDEIIIARDSVGSITTITDGLGRIYRFKYSNGMLEYILSPDNRKTVYNYDTDRNLVRIDGYQVGTVDGELVNLSTYECSEYTYDSSVLSTAISDTGDKLTVAYKGDGTGARAESLKTAVIGSDNVVRPRGKVDITYGTHETVVTDESGRTVTYQFNNYGNTRCIYNSEGQAQYYRYHAPNAQNENGNSTYGPNKLEAASQTHFAVANRILDHGFEETDDWSGDVVTIDTESFENGKSLVFTNEASAVKTAYQTVTVPSNQTYTVSAYVKTSGPDMTLLVDQNDGATVLASASATVSDNEWQRLQATFSVASANTVRVAIKADGEGTAYADAVQLELGETANRYNLLQNGDFVRYPTGNNARPDHWTLSTNGIAGVVTTNTAPASLDLSAHVYTTYPVHLSNTSSTLVTVNTRLSQQVPIRAGVKGTTLSYGAWMKANSLPDMIVDNEEDDTRRFGLTVKLYDASGNVLQTQTTPANRACEDWQFVGDVIVAKQAFAKAEVVLEYVKNANCAYFDGAFLYRDYFGQSFTYDDDGNVLSTTAYDQQQSTFEYSASDELLSSVSPGGAEYAYTYNDAHDVESGTSAEGVTYAYQYEEDTASRNVGLVTSAQTVLGTAQNTATVDTVYDDTTHSPVSQTTIDVRGNAVTYTYNPDGSVATATDATGIVTSYTYDDRGRTTSVSAANADGAVLSTVNYTYDAFDQLTKIENNGVNYYFTYQKCGRLLSVAVGTDDEKTVLSTNTYVANAGIVYRDQVQTMTYGNGDTKSYTYDELDRVVGVRYEGDVQDRFTYTYDREGCLTSQTDTQSGVTISYQYDLSKRLSKIASSDGYTLTYEYDAGNALVSVKESGFGLDDETKYAYNKDDLVTRVVTPTESAVQYDYSYNKKTNYYALSALQANADTYGFASTEGFEATKYEGEDRPVMHGKAVKLTRTTDLTDKANNTTDGENAPFRLRSLMAGDRYELSVWYKAVEGTSGNLKAQIVSGATQTESAQKAIVADGKWHYAVFLLTAPDGLYSSTQTWAYPTMSWTDAAGEGELILNGWSFTDETETVFLPSDLKNMAAANTNVAADATNAVATDTSSPMPGAPVRRWTKTAAAQWIAYGGRGMLTSTPQPGEVWEFSFNAKVESGSCGGIKTYFRKYSESGNLNVDVSAVESVSPTADGAWHTYRTYVTVSDDAYTYNDAILPYFGWGSDSGMGAVLINGMTVRKVGNQWHNAADNLGLSVGVTDDSVVGPIAYEQTVKIENTDGEASLTVDLPTADAPQPTASDTWTLAFWAKAETAPASFVNGETNVPIAADGAWHYVVEHIASADVSAATLQFAVSPSSTLYVNGVSLVPGDVALAHESGQNSAALKNITRTLGNTTSAAKFNTAIEYDTDANRTAYSRIKHYINQGEAISYEYDTAGNISKITNPDGSYVTYTYDALGQLLTEEYSSAVMLPRPMYGSAMDGMNIVKIAYTYDVRGNMLSKVYTWASGDVEYMDTMTYADTVWNDRVTKIKNTAISYDEIGNPLNWTDNATLTWQRGRQLATFNRGSTAVSYVYNDEGIRTSKTVNGTTTTYTILGGSLRSLSDGTNTLRFFENSVEFNGTEYWYIYNAQNDVIGLIDNTGEYVVRYTYSAYGLPLSKTGTLADTLGTLNPFRYRGYIYDEETGLYYCNSRYYDPVVGRWINADEYLFTGCHSVEHNMFAYCLNNCVNKSDLSGTKPGDLFNTIDEAAIDAAQYMVRIGSFDDSWEYATSIYEVKTTIKEKVAITKKKRFLFWEWTVTTYETKKTVKTQYSYKLVVTQKNAVEVAPPKVPLFKKRVAVVHTHPYIKNYDTENFSPEDIEYANVHSVYVYVRTAFGSIKKYDPFTQSETIINSGFSWDPNILR